MYISIVEDHHHLAKTLGALLSRDKDITVMDIFPTAEEALLSIASSTPDVLIVDLKLPGMSGLELIKRVKGNYPYIEIMVFTGICDEQTISSAISAGASGYLLKGGEPAEIIDAIKSVFRGESPFSPKAAKYLIAGIQLDITRHNKASRLLSKREIEILKEMEKGKSHKVVALNLKISPHTVRTHIKAIYKKLDAHNRQEALIKAGL